MKFGFGKKKKEFEPFTKREKDIAIKAIGFTVAQFAPDGASVNSMSIISRLMVADFLESYENFAKMSADEVKLQLEEVTVNARDDGNEKLAAEAEELRKELEKNPDILDE